MTEFEVIMMVMVFINTICLLEMMHLMEEWENE